MDRSYRTRPLLSQLGGGTDSFPSSKALLSSPDTRSGSLPPLLGRGMNPHPAPATCRSLHLSSQVQVQASQVQAPAFAGAGFGRQQNWIPDDRFPAASRGAYKPIVKNGIQLSSSLRSSASLIKCPVR